MSHTYNHFLFSKICLETFLDNCKRILVPPYIKKQPVCCISYCNDDPGTEQELLQTQQIYEFKVHLETLGVHVLFDPCDEEKNYLHPLIEKIKDCDSIFLIGIPSLKETPNHIKTEFARLQEKVGINSDGFFVLLFMQGEGDLSITLEHTLPDDYPQEKKNNLFIRDCRRSNHPTDLSVYIHSLTSVGKEESRNETTNQQGIIPIIYRMTQNPHLLHIYTPLQDLLRLALSLMNHRNSPLCAKEFESHSSNNDDNDDEWKILSIFLDLTIAEWLDQEKINDKERCLSDLIRIYLRRIHSVMKDEKVWSEVWQKFNLHYNSIFLDEEKERNSFSSVKDALENTNPNLSQGTTEPSPQEDTSIFRTAQEAWKSLQQQFVVNYESNNMRTNLETVFDELEKMEDALSDLCKINHSSSVADAARTISSIKTAFHLTKEPVTTVLQKTATKHSVEGVTKEEKWAAKVKEEALRLFISVRKIQQAGVPSMPFQSHDLSHAGNSLQQIAHQRNIEEEEVTENNGANQPQNHQMKWILLDSLLKQLNELCNQQREMENGRAEAQMDCTTLSEHHVEQLSEKVRKYRKILTDIRKEIGECKHQLSNHLSCVRFHSASHESQESKQSNPVNGLEECKTKVLTKEALEHFCKITREGLQGFQESQQKLEITLSSFKDIDSMIFALNYLRKIDQLSHEMSDYLDKIQTNTTNNDLQVASHCKVVFDQYYKARTCYLNATRLFLNGDDNSTITKQLIIAAEIFEDSVIYAKNLSDNFDPQNDLVQLKNVKQNMTTLFIEINEKFLKLSNQIGLAYEKNEFTTVRRRFTEEPRNILSIAWNCCTRIHTIRNYSESFFSLWKDCIEEMMDFEKESSPPTWEKAFIALQFGFKLFLKKEENLEPAEYKAVLKYLEASVRYYFSNNHLCGDLCSRIATELATTLENYEDILHQQRKYNQLLLQPLTIKADDQIKECQQQALKVAFDLTKHYEQVLEKVQMNIEEVLDNIPMMIDEQNVFEDDERVENVIASLFHLDVMKQTREKMSLYEKAANCFMKVDNLRKEILPNLFDNGNDGHHDFSQSMECWCIAGTQSKDLANGYEAAMEDGQAEWKAKQIQYRETAATYFTIAGGGMDEVSESYRRAAGSSTQFAQFTLSDAGQGKVDDKSFQKCIDCFTKAAYYFNESERRSQQEPCNSRFFKQIALYYQRFGWIWEEFAFSLKIVPNQIRKSYENGKPYLENLEKYLAYLQPLPFQLEEDDDDDKEAKRRRRLFGQIPHGIMQISLDLAIYWKEKAMEIKTRNIRRDRFANVKIKSFKSHARNELKQSMKFFEKIIRCYNALNNESCSIDIARKENDLTMINKPPSLSTSGIIHQLRYHLEQEMNNHLDQAWENIIKANQFIIDLYQEMNMERTLMKSDLFPLALKIETTTCLLL